MAIMSALPEPLLDVLRRKLARQPAPRSRAAC
jgi:hypothetical protein